MEESSDPKIRRRVSLQFFRSLITKGSSRVTELFKTEVYKLVAKTPYDWDWSLRGWREKEGGYRLASVLAELDALMCTLLQQSTLTNHSVRSSKDNQYLMINTHFLIIIR
ncbi:hypothetical protein F2Q70_00036908 [Brassica cretica]|uniref:Uncharacterized protein n=1 Tax=Brassica cretica TaxID=69181 RepID=A0A8S9JRV9_BRACR|nr:hypothetical protein F2Q68_00029943 [Brassica cretica]KAF2584073.1 hypothetical protein F2Q70_00036908 [Brassica cretica]